MSIELTEDEKQCLLQEAREAIASELDGRPGRYERPESVQARLDAGTSALSIPCGAFVTLHKGKSLRGCIGRMIGIRPLEETVRTMARAAAFEDPRFPPLRKDELAQCKIEISVLSPMERCPDPRSVQIGVHGLYLVHRGYSGVLLPQVPVEQGWDLDEYLDYICRKAGLPPGAYNEPGAELYTFTALVFGE
ncbi:MAG TPA: AmmeMemoRadiSam system protein A [Treponema sp.]|jgi:AmmeMemoRadiSam system protein A|nr:AmmeMemoRadiSam system protein A [Treponema sp.]HRS04203.1 AmmeMemoRadiSam system protein A [Treponema sp.]